MVLLIGLSHCRGVPGKFLPHIEQRTENMLATEKPKKKKASKSDS